MREDKNQVGENLSSGAEKVEEIVRQQHQDPKNITQAQAAAEREKAAADARVAAALAKQENERRKEEFFRRRKDNKDAYERKGGKENKKSSNGPWIAVVASLGTATLALAVALTVGAIDMKKTKDGVMSGYKATAYELTGIMEHVDDDLDRVRLSSDSAQQQRILTDLLVQVRLAELDLEKLPVDGQQDMHLTSFINRVGTECERMLSKLRSGEKLSENDIKRLEEMYEKCHGIHAKIVELTQNVTDESIGNYLKNGGGMIGDAMQAIEDMTMPENRKQKQESKGAGTKQIPPKGGYQPKISPNEATELCRRYFNDYEIENFQCTGETLTRGYCAYNVQGYDDNGTLLYAEVDWASGALLRFNYYEPCEEKNFDMDNARMLAQTFLSKLGYENMTAINGRENGSDADFTFVYEMDGTVFYPDTVWVKVCRTRGMVTGMDATKFVKNHTPRTQPQVKLSLQNAQSKLRAGLDVQASRLCVVNTLRGERTAYEFLCGYGEERYLIYIDAQTGAEISIINVKNFV